MTGVSSGMNEKGRTGDRPGGGKTLLKNLYVCVCVIRFINI